MDVEGIKKNEIKINIIREKESRANVREKEKSKRAE